MDTEEELELLGSTSLSHSTFNFTGNMFLMELSQLSDDDLGRMQILLDDMELFLHLKRGSLSSASDLDEMLTLKHNSTDYLLKLEQKERYSTLDICEEKYKPLRENLVSIGMVASTWIKDYLLKSPRVIVSSRDFFLESIDLWKFDPCNDDDDAEATSRLRQRGLLVDDYELNHSM